MHDPDKTEETEDLKDKQRRHQQAAQPLSRADRAEPLGSPPASKPLHQAPKPSDLVK